MDKCLLLGHLQIEAGENSRLKSTLGDKSYNYLQSIGFQNFILKKVV